jgi:hypothetical protein
MKSGRRWACFGLVTLVVLMVVYFGPSVWLSMITSAHSTQVKGWQDPAVRVLPLRPYDVNVDRVIFLLPFVPSVQEVRLPEIANVKPRLARLARVPSIISLYLFNIGLTDDDLSELSDMPQLEWLNIGGNEKVSDVGIAHLAQCRRLRHLNLESTGVVGMSLEKLAGCKDIDTLELMNCPVTDEAIVRIPRFPKIVNVNLSDTRMTEKGLMHFVNWHYLKLLAIPNEISREARLEFNREWRAEYDRAREAGEDVPSVPGRGVFVFPAN